MKFVILLAVVVLVLWVLRGLRKPSVPPTASSRESGSGTQEKMVSCEQCGVHLPRSEALPGRGGVFCSDAHRKAFESKREP